MKKPSLVILSFLLSCFLHLVTLANDKPLKIFILCGQSNMEGHAKINTFEAMKLDPVTKPIYQEMVDSSGDPITCEQVWISYFTGGRDNMGEGYGKLTAGYGSRRVPSEMGEKIGPEYTFGIYAQKALKEPILIIKTAWGGKSLNTDFRTPSAGPYTFNENQLENFAKQDKEVAEQQKQKDDATGVYYRLMLEHVQHVLSDIGRVYPEYDQTEGHELAGLVWFQGWNDMVDRGTYPKRDQEGGYQKYSDVMAHFIRDVRKDLSAPELPIVIGVLGVGGPTEKYTENEQRYRGIHNNFRTAMAAPASMPEFEENVTAVWTDQYWDMELKRLRTDDSKIQAELKKKAEMEGKNRAELQAMILENRSERLTKPQLELLTNGASNAEYHYLGSVKIMSQIGKGFAEAMLELMPSEKNATNH